MSENIEVVLDQDQLGALGSFFAGELSTISPLRSDKEGDEQSSPPGPEVLIENGVCMEDGTILKGYRPVMEVLATARGFARIFFTDETGNTSECINYFSPDRRRVTMTNVEGAFKLSYPDASADIIEGLSQHFGDTAYRSADLNAELSIGEALVFSVLVDNQRKAFLKGIAGDRDLKPKGMDDAKLAEGLSGAGESLQWLTNVCMELFGIDEANPEDVLDSGLEGLLSKGLITKKASKFYLADTGFSLSRRMLVIDRILSLGSGWINTGGVLEVSGFTCLQAGVHDLLLLEAFDDTLHIRSISSAELLDIITSSLLGGFIAEEEPAEQTATPAPSATMPPAAPPAPPVAQQVASAQPVQVPRSQDQQQPPAQPIPQPQRQPVQHPAQPVQQPQQHTQQSPPQNQQAYQQPARQQMPGAQQPQQVVKCSKCGGPATYYHQVGKWYCHACEKYL